MAERESSLQSNSEDKKDEWQEMMGRIDQRQYDKKGEELRERIAEFRKKHAGKSEKDKKTNKE